MPEATIQNPGKGWDYIKKTTLWHYEDLIKKISVLMSYPVIWKAYNHNMAQATVFAMRLFPDKNIEMVNILPRYLIPLRA